MGDLLGDKSEVWLNKLECLSEDWVEWLSVSTIDFTVLREKEARNHTHLFAFIILNFESSVHKTGKEYDFRDFLKHTDRFIKPNRHSNLSDIFSNSTLEDLPDTIALVLRDQSGKFGSASQIIGHWDTTIAHDNWSVWGDRQESRNYSQ